MQDATPVDQPQGTVMAGHRAEIRAGSTIFAENDAPTTAYLIESGEVEVSTLQRGERTVLGHLGPGMLLGEMAVLDNSPRSASARAISDCVLIPIDRRQFAERLAAADPVVRALLMIQLTRFRSALATLTGDEPDTFPLLADVATRQDAGAFDKIRLESE